MREPVSHLSSFFASLYFHSRDRDRGTETETEGKRESHRKSAKLRVEPEGATSDQNTKDHNPIDFPSPPCGEGSSLHILQVTTLAAAFGAPRSALVTTRPLAVHSLISASRPSSILTRLYGAESETFVKKKVEDVMPIATGHEREELESEFERRGILDIDHPQRPIDTKKSPEVIKSSYDKSVAGCSGVEGEDEHDMEKGTPHECPVCLQYFVLEVTGRGGRNPFI